MDKQVFYEYCGICGCPLDANGHCTNPDCPMSMIPESVAKTEAKEVEEKDRIAVGQTRLGVAGIKTHGR